MSIVAVSLRGTIYSKRYSLRPKTSASFGFLDPKSEQVRARRILRKLVQNLACSLAGDFKDEHSIWHVPTKNPPKNCQNVSTCYDTTTAFFLSANSVFFLRIFSAFQRAQGHGLTPDIEGVTGAVKIFAQNVRRRMCQG